MKSEGCALAAGWGGHMGDLGPASVSFYSSSGPISSSEISAYASGSVISW